MQIVKELFDASSVTDHDVRKLLQQRFAEISPNGTDASNDTRFYVVESNDEIEALEDATGCPIVTSWFTTAIYPDENFAPCFEYIEEHRCCFEMVFVLNDDSSTVVILVPKNKSIDATLLKLCAEYSNEVANAEI